MHEKIEIAKINIVLITLTLPQIFICLQIKENWAAIVKINKIIESANLERLRI